MKNQKRKEKKIRNKQSTRDWLPFENILEDGVVKHKDGFVKIIKVFPINYDLKSNLEKEAILNAYHIFLKTCDFDLQILVQSKKENLSKHISHIQKSLSDEKNPNIIDISEKYIEFIKGKNEENKSASKNFYIVIKENISNSINGEEIARNNLNEKYYKVKESLEKVGNKTKEINNKKETQKVLLSFYNQRVAKKIF